MRSIAVLPPSAAAACLAQPALLGGTGPQITVEASSSPGVAQLLAAVNQKRAEANKPPLAI